MSSTYNDVRAAIEGRIATELALAPDYPVSYQNVPFTPSQQHAMGAGLYPLWRQQLCHAD
jgi:hypothetical protein